jgi:hypothetical protein
MSAVTSRAEISQDPGLQAMAKALQQEWALRFGRPAARACLTLQGQTLFVRLQNALSETERAFGSQPGGPEAVRQQVLRHMDAVYPWLAHEVETVFQCAVGESDVTVDFADGSISCNLHLRGLPRDAQLFGWGLDRPCFD